MNAQERRNQSQPDQHFNPAVVEWAPPEEGMAIRLQLADPEMEELSPASREKMTLMLGRMALLCQYVVTNPEGLAKAGLTTEGAFNFLAAYMTDLTDLLQMMAGTRPDIEEIEFPF